MDSDLVGFHVFAATSELMGTEDSEIHLALIK